MMLKRLFYLGLGLSTNLLVFIVVFRLVFVNIINNASKEASMTLVIILSSLLTLLVIASVQLILYGISYWHTGAINWKGKWRNNLKHGKGTLYADDGNMICNCIHESDQFIDFISD